MRKYDQKNLQEKVEISGNFKPRLKECKRNTKRVWLWYDIGIRYRDVLGVNIGWCRSDKAIPGVLSLDDTAVLEWRQEYFSTLIDGAAMLVRWEDNFLSLCSWSCCDEMTARSFTSFINYLLKLWCQFDDRNTPKHSLADMVLLWRQDLSLPIIDWAMVLEGWQGHSLPLICLSCAVGMVTESFFTTYYRKNLYQVDWIISLPFICWRLVLEWWRDHSRPLNTAVVLLWTYNNKYVSVKSKKLENTPNCF